MRHACHRWRLSCAAMMWRPVARLNRLARMKGLGNRTAARSTSAYSRRKSSGPPTRQWSVKPCFLWRRQNKGLDDKTLTEEETNRQIKQCATTAPSKSRPNSGQTSDHSRETLPVMRPQPIQLMAAQASFVAQGHHGIDAHRSSRRDVARKQRYKAENPGHTAESNRVGWLDSVEQLGHQPRQQQGADDASERPNEREQHPLPEHEEQYMGPACTE